MFVIYEESLEEELCSVDNDNDNDDDDNGLLQIPTIRRLFFCKKRERSRYIENFEGLKVSYIRKFVVSRDVSVYI